jgi:hypothetical protein
VFRPIKLVYTDHFFNEVPVPRQESEWSCICVFGILILPLSTIFIFYFGNVPRGIFFHLITVLFSHIAVHAVYHTKSIIHCVFYVIEVDSSLYVV